MTDLSVIVSGRGPLGRFRACLESVSTQAHPDLDIVVTVAADAASTRSVAEDLAARDPRVTVVPLPAGTSPAAARAAGARAATGRHLQFLHSADWLPSGATDALARWIRGLDAAPDVVLLDHHQAHWWDGSVPGGDTAILAEAGHTPIALADCPALVTVAPLLGNRLISARLFADHTELFSADGHDELFLSYATTLLADRIACYDRVALVHRRDRDERPRPGTDRDHVAVLHQYERVHQLPALRQAPAGARALLYDRMVGDYLAALARRDEIPAEHVPEFFRRAAEHTRRFRPEGHRRPGGLAGFRHELLGRNARLRYRLLQAVGERQHDLEATAKKYRRTAGDWRARRRYRRALNRPLHQDLAVFSAYWGRGVSCNPAAIAAELAVRAPEIRRVWVVERPYVPLLPPGTDYVVPGTARYREVLARAKYLVNNVNFPNAVAKRPGSVHLQTHHGTPLKRMGLDQRDFPAAAQGLDFRTLLERVDRWDYSLSANSHSTQTWERAYPSEYVSLDYGYPRNDIFYRATADDVLAARAKLGIRPGQRALLYAPTHRDYESRWTPRIDLAALAERLGEDTVLLIRGHYFYDSPLPEEVRAHVLDVSGYDPVEELALAADALITDYSSIMFDYANLDRPIVVFADDWDTYTRIRGVYFDLPAEAPGPVARTESELAGILTTGAWCDEAAATQRRDFRRRFCEYDDGRAAERVVRRVFLGEGETSLSPVVPLERRTPAPTPQEAAR
ncbi:CDP-glycerol glycerophosphotransferase family protein [Streptomyces sp. NPDC002577]